MEMTLSHNWLTNQTLTTNTQVVGNDIKSFDDYYNQVHPDDLEALLISEIRYLEKLTPTLVITSRFKRVNDWVWLEATYNALFDKHCPVALVITHREVTDLMLNYDI